MRQNEEIISFRLSERLRKFFVRIGERCRTDEVPRADYRGHRFARDGRVPCRSTLTLDKARELLSMRADAGGGYNRNATIKVLADVECRHGQQVVDDLIHEFNLESTFNVKPGRSILLNED